MKRVLLTGATGFIGRHCLSRLLGNGYEVHAVSSRTPPEGQPGVDWHKADLLEPGQALKLVHEVRPTHLLHLAWYAVPGEYWTSSENLRWVQASLELLRAFAASGGQRIVVAGTCAEYDWQYGYCREQVTPLLPRTLYGACKHSLQLMLTTFAAQTELSAAWGRIFFLYGPKEQPNRLVASVVRSVLQGQPARSSHGEQVRDFLHVEDVAEAFVALLGSAVSGPVNVASGRPVAIKDMVYAIADSVGKRDLVRLGEVPVPASDPPLLVADVGRLRNEVGWRPRYDLASGLEQTIEWWKAKGFTPTLQEHV